MTENVLKVIFLKSCCPCVSKVSKLMFVKYSYSARILRKTTEEWRHVFHKVNHSTMMLSNFYLLAWSFAFFFIFIISSISLPISFSTVVAIGWKYVVGVVILKFPYCYLIQNSLFLGLRNTNELELFIWSNYYLKIIGFPSAIYNLHHCNPFRLLQRITSLSRNKQIIHLQTNT